MKKGRTRHDISLPKTISTINNRANLYLIIGYSDLVIYQNQRLQVLESANRALRVSQGWMGLAHIEAGGGSRDVLIESEAC